MFVQMMILGQIYVSIDWGVGGGRGEGRGGGGSWKIIFSICISDDDKYVNYRRFQTTSKFFSDTATQKWPRHVSSLPKLI